jgi:DHA2 family multidrug resistance protein-like MFS transporter
MPETSLPDSHHSVPAAQAGARHPAATSATSATSPEPPDGLPTPQRYWAVVVVVLGITLAVLDSAIANVALPTIAHTLHADAATSIWVVNAYQLAIVISLLPLSSLGDIIGHRRIYLVGLALFTAASLGCALSDSMLGLTTARVIQGFGAAGIMSVNTALVRLIYPYRMLGRGVSINASVVAISTALGPSIASAILSVGNWPWLFAVNVPIGIAAVCVGLRFLPRQAVQARRFDVRSAILNALTFGLLIISVDGLGHGQHYPLVGAEIAAMVLIAIVFVRRQLTQAVPLLPVDLLRLPIFALSVGTSICSFIAQMLAFVSLPFYFQDTLGLSQVQTGLLMTPWPLVIIVIAPVAGHLSDRYSAGILGGIGLATLALGLALLATLPPHPEYAAIIWRMAVCGFGFGMFQSPNNRAMLAAAPRERSGGASGMLSTARLVGQSLGAALVALIFNLAPVRGTTLTLVTAAVFSALAAGVSLTRLSLASRPMPTR